MLGHSGGDRTNNVFDDDDKASRKSMSRKGPTIVEELKSQKTGGSPKNRLSPSNGMIR